MPDGLLEIALAAFEVSPDFLWRRCIGYVHRTTVGTHVFHKAFGKICRSAFCLSAEQKVDFAVAANGFHSCLVMLADVYLGKHLVVVNHAPMQIIDNYPISQVGALGYQHIHQLVGTIVWYCVVDKFVELGRCYYSLGVVVKVDIHHIVAPLFHPHFLLAERH